MVIILFCAFEAEKLRKLWTRVQARTFNENLIMTKGM